jgi:NTP pyrophosphatase (non-canonical NTP hydrolase)
MNFNEYQEKAEEFAIYPNQGNNLAYPILGLCEEAGEVAGKLAKLIRSGKEPTQQDKEEIAKELGDTQWFLTAVCREIGISLNEVAVRNLDKLQSRKDRNKLQGSGDNR